MGYYDQPLVVTYTFPAVDFAAGTTNHAIKPPAGYDKGRIFDVGVAVTEVFNAVTTAAFVRIGTATDADAYVELNMGTAAATDYYNTRDDTDAIIEADIPAATQLEVACIANTGGTATGIGTVHVTIGWY